MQLAAVLARSLVVLGQCLGRLGETASLQDAKFCCVFACAKTASASDHSATEALALYCKHFTLMYWTSFQSKCTPEQRQNREE